MSHMVFFVTKNTIRSLRRSKTISLVVFKRTCLSAILSSNVFFYLATLLRAMSTKSSTPKNHKRNWCFESVRLIQQTGHWRKSFVSHVFFFFSSFQTNLLTTPLYSLPVLWHFFFVWAFVWSSILVCLIVFYSSTYWFECCS